MEEQKFKLTIELVPSTSSIYQIYKRSNQLNKWRKIKNINCCIYLSCGQKRFPLNRVFGKKNSVRMASTLHATNASSVFFTISAIKGAKSHPPA